MPVYHGSSSLDCPGQWLALADHSNCGTPGVSGTVVLDVRPDETDDVHGREGA